MQAIITPKAIGPGMAREKSRVGANDMPTALSPNESRNPQRMRRRNDRPSRMRGQSCIDPTEIPKDLLGERVPCTSPNKAAGETQQPSMCRPGRIRGMSLRDLELPADDSSCSSSSDGETLPGDDMFSGEDLSGMDSEEVSPEKQSESPKSPFPIPNKMNKVRRKVNNSPKRLVASKDFVPGKLCTLGFQETKPKTIYKIRANCPDGKVKIIKGSLEALRKHVETQKKLGKPLTEAPCKAIDRSIVPKDRPTRTRGLSFRALSDVAVKGDESDDSSSDGDSFSDSDSVISYTERTDDYTERTQDDFEDGSLRIDDDEIFSPGKLCTLGFQERHRKPIYKIRANCPQGQVSGIKEEFESSHGSGVSTVDVEDVFKPGKLCTLDFQDSNRKPIYRIQANCPRGQVNSMREELESSHGSGVSLVCKLTPNCPDGQVRGVTENMETDTREQQRPTLGRVGREASVKASISVKETLKAFQ